MRVDEVDDIRGDDRLAEASKPLAEALRSIEDDLSPGGLRAIVFMYDPKTNKGNLMLANYMGEEDALLDAEQLPNAIKGRHR